MGSVLETKEERRQRKKNKKRKRGERPNMWFLFFFRALLLPSSEVAGAHLADPDRLWPGGVVEYRFHRTFPRDDQAKMREAMAYITSETPCITFVHDADSSAVNFVTIYPGTNCKSDLGMKGGEQSIFLNSACFDNGLITPVHELLHTLGFVHEHSRPDRDEFITVNLTNVATQNFRSFEKRPFGNAEFHESHSVDHQHTPYDIFSVLHFGPMSFSKNGEEVITFRYGLPDDDEPWDFRLSGQTTENPLSLIDKIELSLTYGCTEKLSNDKILDYIHHNRLHNALRIKFIEKETKEEMEALEQKIAPKSEQDEIKKRLLKLEKEIKEREEEIEGQRIKIEGQRVKLAEQKGTIEKQAEDIAKQHDEMVERKYGEQNMKEKIDKLEEKIRKYC